MKLIAPENGCELLFIVENRVGVPESDPLTMHANSSQMTYLFGKEKGRREAMITLTPKGAVLNDKSGTHRCAP